MFKKMFAAILTVALILTLNASAFATEGENLDGQHDQGMTTEYYNPFGSNYGIHAPTNSELREVPTLTVTGYSGKTLYSDSGNMYKYTSSRIYYLLDTESGASGAPVYDKEFGYYVWAIHTHGYDNDGNALNSGWRITSDFINELVDLGYVTRG